MSTPFTAPARKKRTVVHPDSVGLLMSLVRSLSQSENPQEREDIKRELEKAFKECDQNMDKLILTHHDDLTSLIQAFSKIYSRITTSREKIKDIKHKLISCKTLLHCKRDELKRLYVEGIEQKQVLALLEQIEKVKEVPQKLQTYMSKKHYLHASEELVNALARLEGDLNGVEGLRDLRTELQDKKEKLRKELVEELHKHLYIRSTSDAMRSFRRQGSDRFSFHRHGSERQKQASMSNLRGGALSVSVIGTPSKMDLSGLGRSPWQQDRSRAKLSVPAAPSFTGFEKEVFEDLTVDNPEENSYHYMAILIESLNILGKLPDAVEEIKVRLETEMFAIVRRAAQQVIDSAFLHDQSQQNNPRLLLDLMQLVFAQFRCVAQAHECVLKNLKRISDSSSQVHGELHLYTNAEVWSRIQGVLQEVLREYLDIQNTTTSNQPQGSAPKFADANTVAENINAYFAKKRPAKILNKKPLFRFESSSHAISMTSYLREQRQGLYGSVDELDHDTSTNFTENRHELVCAPNARNITVIFSALLKFIDEIQSGIGTQCTLHEFVTDYVKQVFLHNIQFDMSSRVDSATRCMDTLKSITDHETLKSLNLQRPVLQSTVSIHKCVEELTELAQNMPLYAEQFLTMTVVMLKDYKEICQAVYRDIVQPDSEDKRIISANWAKDEDLNRFLRGLPNWQNLLQQQDNKLVDHEETPEDIRARNMKESETLIQMVGDQSIPQHEILSDPNQMRTLGNLQESLSWLAERTYYMATCLPTVSIQTESLSESLMEIPPVAENIIQSLIAISREFEELAELCLLVLHLEVRIHCFYYLIPLAHQEDFFCGPDDVETDVEVVRLNKNISAIDEAMSTSLQVRKFKYIFEGLGHLIASVLINSAEYIQRINENGIKKMCRDVFAIQQNLNNITMQRESDLIEARLYYELLYSSPDTILENIMDQGPKFTELEYINALSLLHRSQPAAEMHQLNSRLYKLKEIINDTVRV